MNLKWVEPYTKQRGGRLQHWADTLHKLAVDGDIVECGVWRGGAIMLARKLCPDRVCWLFDTFDGMPAPDVIDGEKARARYDAKTTTGRKWAAAAFDEVRGYFAEQGLLDESKLRFVRGQVERTLRREPLPKRIAVLRLDTDWHASTAVALKVLYPRVVPGGVLVVDDFGHWQGAQKAVVDYFGVGVVQRLHLIDYSAVALRK